MIREMIEGSWDEEEGIYEEDGIINLEENDEITIEECGFMAGYISAE